MIKMGRRTEDKRVGEEEGEGGGPEKAGVRGG
jgi:hypothetical protein